MKNKGFTIVECLLAIIILLIVVTGGGMFIIKGFGRITLEKNKYAAITSANARLEKLASIPYSSILPINQDYAIYYIEEQAGTLVIQTTDPGETVSINGHSLPITTTIQYEDIDGGTPSYDILHVSINVGYRVNSTATILLETYLRD